jgi:hypothetical protein
MKPYLFNLSDAHRTYTKANRMPRIRCVFVVSPTSSSMLVSILVGQYVQIDRIVENRKPVGNKLRWYLMIRRATIRKYTERRKKDEEERCFQRHQTNTSRSSCANLSSYFTWILSSSRLHDDVPLGHRSIVYRSCVRCSRIYVRTNNRTTNHITHR